MDGQMGFERCPARRYGAGEVVIYKGKRAGCLGRELGIGGEGEREEGKKKEGKRKGEKKEKEEGKRN